MTSLSKKQLLVHLNKQTGKIRWPELEKSYAQGCVFLVSFGVDLLEVACDIIQDNKTGIGALLDNNQLKKVEETQAQIWTKNDVEFWAVVAAPYVLIQVVTN